MLANPVPAAALKSLTNAASNKANSPSTFSAVKADSTSASTGGSSFPPPIGFNSATYK